MLRTEALLLTALAYLTPTLLFAQTMEVLLREGDKLSDGTTVSEIDSMAAGNEGAWAARVFTSGGSAGLGDVLLINGDIALRRGDTLSSSGRCCLIATVHVEFDPLGVPLILVHMTDAPALQGAGILRG